jgi:proline iminopeptidase
MHYESNHFFIKDNELLDNVDKIKAIPLAIIHGRHDILCPFKRAWDLYKVHGNAEIVALPQSNHAFSADGSVARKYFYDAFLKKHNL